MYNVNGLRDERKRREVFHYLHTKKFDIMFLQEIHSVKCEEKYWSSMWGSKIWFDHGETNARGVAILFSPNVKVTVHNVIKSEVGHYIILYVSYGNIKLLLANIYAPNKDDPGFFMEVFENVERFTLHYRIIGGDFNLGIEKNFDRYGVGTNNDKAAEWLKNHIDNNNYVDTWRFFHPESNGFMWRKLRPKPAFSRLDYLLVSEVFLQFIDKVRICPGLELIILWWKLWSIFYSKKGDQGTGSLIQVCCSIRIIWIKLILC